MSPRPLISQSASVARQHAALRVARRRRSQVRMILGCALTVIAVMAAVFIYIERAELLVLAVIAVPALLCWASLWLRPYRTCRDCRGSGTIHGLVFRQAHAFCVRCGGNGPVPRFGTRFLSPEHRPPDRTGARR